VNPFPFTERSTKMFGRIAAATIAAIFVLSLFISASVSTPPPEDFQVEEYAWLKEEGEDPSAWGQYNNTGWNRLDLTYVFSKCNLAYVVRTNGSADFNVTFIVYHNSSAGSGFDREGHLFPGTGPNWTLTAGASLSQPSGGYSYNLFVTTFDPQGIGGDYQVRINETGPGRGSNWTSPDGNPAVQWMFFRVPTATPQTSITDQTGSGEPFYLDGGAQTTHLNATMLFSPPGNETAASVATVLWRDTSGQVIMNRSSPITYVGSGKWLVQDVVRANASAFPYNATDPYTVSLQAGYFSGSASFRILSTNWVRAELDVLPIEGQWFDPSSFRVRYAASINTGLPGNPYQDVSNVTLEFWNQTDRVALLANLSWDITGYTVIEGSTYTYTWTGMIPVEYIDRAPGREFFGPYSVRCDPPSAMYPGLASRGDFYVDDPIESYTSLEKASMAPRSAFKEGSVIWFNLELNPTYLRVPQNQNAPFEQKEASITWLWPTPPPDHVKTEMANGTKNSSWPSDQYWAFSSLNTSGFPDGVYWIAASADCRTGYTVWETKSYDIYQSYSPPTEANPMPPITRIAVRPAPNGTWSTVPVMIKFYPSDPGVGGSGVENMFYQVDGGDAVELGYQPTSIPALEGSHTYTYWAQDRAGNVEIPKTRVVNVDTAPPNTRISPPGGDWQRPGPVTIRLHATDPAPGSGVNATFYAIDDSDPVEYPIDGFPALEGDHTYRYWSEDLAGNAEDPNSARIMVVSDAPAAILALASLLSTLVALRRDRRW